MYVIHVHMYVHVYMYVYDCVCIIHTQTHTSYVGHAGMTCTPDFPEDPLRLRFLPLQACRSCQSCPVVPQPSSQTCVYIVHVYIDEEKHLLQRVYMHVCIIASIHKHTSEAPRFKQVITLCECACVYLVRTHLHTPAHTHAHGQTHMMTRPTLPPCSPRSPWGP